MIKLITVSVTNIYCSCPSAAYTLYMWMNKIKFKCRITAVEKSYPTATTGNQTQGHQSGSTTYQRSNHWAIAYWDSRAGQSEISIIIQYGYLWLPWLGVPIAQWLECWYIKPETLGSIPGWGSQITFLNSSDSTSFGFNLIHS